MLLAWLPIASLDLWHFLTSARVNGVCRQSRRPTGCQQNGHHEVLCGTLCLPLLPSAGQVMVSVFQGWKLKFDFKKFSIVYMTFPKYDTAANTLNHHASLRQLQKERFLFSIEKFTTCLREQLNKRATKRYSVKVCDSTIDSPVLTAVWCWSPQQEMIDDTA